MPVNKDVGADRNLVSIVILNYDGKEDSLALLDSLKSTDYPNYETIFVDNASSDGSVAAVRKEHPQVRIIRNDENLGYAGGMNTGIRASRGEYVILLNNDMVVCQDDWLTRLVDFADAHKDVAMVRGMFIYYGTDLIDTVGQQERNAVLRVLNPYIPLFKRVSLKDAGDLREVIEISGGNGLFRKSALEKVGLLDEKMFVYFEETDLCYRLAKAGYRMFSITSSRMLHKGSATIRKGSYFSVFHNYKNKLRFYLKNYDIVSKTFAVFFNMIYYLSMIGLYMAQGRYDLSVAVRDAIVWNVKNRKDYGIP